MRTAPGLVVEGVDILLEEGRFLGWKRGIMEDCLDSVARVKQSYVDEIFTTGNEGE